jgi:site-specific recombinase XerD
MHGQRWYQDATVRPLRLRVSRRGLAWVFHGRTRNGPRRRPLGKHPRMDIEQARAAAQRIASETAPASTPLTFSQLRLAYFDSAEFKRLSSRTQKSYKWVLQGKDYEGLAPRKLRDISRLDLLAIKDAIAADGRAFQNVLRPAQALFSWALDRGLVDVSPATRLKLPLNQADPQPYTDDELGDMVVAVKKAIEPWRTLYLLVAYTGQRPSTWTDAKWNEISLKSGTLTVSRVRGRRSKLKKGWAIPLAKPVMALLQALLKRQGRDKNEWLFGRALVAESKIRNTIAKAAGLPKEANRGNLHRFRATMLTKLDQWGTSVEVAQRLAGHAAAFAGARAHYVTATPSPEMRKTADRYGEHVDYCELL